MRHLPSTFITIRVSDTGFSDEPAQFYNAVLFMGSVAVFSLIAQRMNATR